MDFSPIIELYFLAKNNDRLQRLQDFLNTVRSELMQAVLGKTNDSSIIKIWTNQVADTKSRLERLILAKALWLALEQQSLDSEMKDGN